MLDHGGVLDVTKHIHGLLCHTIPWNIVYTFHLYYISFILTFYLYPLREMF